MKNVQMRLHNAFHNTTCTVHPKDVHVQPSNYYDGYLSKRQVQNINKALCGMKDCKCGGIDNVRGFVIHPVCNPDKNKEYYFFKAYGLK